MSPHLDPFPGGEGCPLEAFRRRALRVLWTLALLGAFGLAFGVIWLDGTSLSLCKQLTRTSP